ncbi:hypothetical protein N8590_02540 [bacterium]|nr:hypothetical protein [Planctomicrobium sp.]MDA7503914.1 hypothetical protein [bacterium]MDA7527843.1 hypothetical protein [bacterium]MDB4731587.1 hypothetical protein [bacterium]
MKSKIVFLTGASHSGKSHLVGELRKRDVAPIMESDIEIMGRVFDVLNCPELKSEIGCPEKWKELYLSADVDRLIRLHHRDWFARNSFPKVAVLEGWIYSQSKIREQVYSAFSQFSHLEFEYYFVHWKPDFKTFVERYLKREDRNAQENPKHLFHKTRNFDKEAHASKQYEVYLKEKYRPPTAVEVVETYETDDNQQVIDLLNRLNSSS